MCQCQKKSSINKGCGGEERKMTTRYVRPTQTRRDSIAERPELCIPILRDIVGRAVKKKLETDVALGFTPANKSATTVPPNV